LRPILGKLAQKHEIDPDHVAEFVANIKAGKFRKQVPESLARSLWAKQNFTKIGGISTMAGGL
jgi:ATP-dependent Lhr-like helicase